MASITLLLCCVILHVCVDCEPNPEHAIHKRAATPCPGGRFQLCEKGVRETTSTKTSIKEEAEQKKSSKLYESYVELMEEENRSFYNSKISIGEYLGLSKDETEAVLLYTMDKFKLYKELNDKLREGRDIYPVFHYWLNKAIGKLHITSYALFRGYKDTVTIDNGTILRLPGFSSTSINIQVAKEDFSQEGCTILQFDYSRQAGYVGNLSWFAEGEYVIPPTEQFEVYNTTSDGVYDYIYLKPSLRSKRSTTVYTLCGGCSPQTYSPILMVLVIIQRFF